MTYILVEGKEDKHFIEYLLKNILNISDDLYKIEFNGSHGITDDRALDIKRSIDNSEAVIVINDADNDIITRKDELSKKIKKIDVNAKVSVFLLPDNNSSGKLENLLLECIPENKEYILNCYDEMIDCFKKCYKYMEKELSKKRLYIPDIYNKTYLYVDVHLDKNGKQARFKSGSKYAYYKKDIWNFSSDKIKPLIDFLKDNVN